MAKGDADRYQNLINKSTDQNQNQLNDMRSSLIPQNQALQNRYNVSADQSEKDYGNIQNGYQSFLQQAGNPNSYSGYSGYQNFANGGRDSVLNPQGLSAITDAIGGYHNFADTGGYSPTDVAAIRARAQGPIRSAYDSASQNIDRQRNLQGGYSPNYGALQTKLARDSSQQMADAQTGVEASLADQIRQGKLAGLSGLSNLGGMQENAGLQLDQANNANRLSGLGGLTSIDVNRLGNTLNGLQGMTSAYSATPGQTNMYGNQLNQSNTNLTNIQQLQQALSQMLLGSQFNKAQVPTNFNQALGNIGQIANIGSKFIPGAGLFGGG